MRHAAEVAEGGGVTLVDDEAQLLDGGQVPADSVDPIHLQTWRHTDHQGAPLTIGGGCPTEHQRAALTSLVHGVHTHLQEARHRASLPLTQRGQLAAEDSI